MAIVMQLEIPGGTIEQYEQLNEKLGISGDDDAPDGLILHSVGQTDDGVLIVDVWESAEKLSAFFDTALGAGMQEVGVPQSEPKIHQLHNMIPQGAGGDATVMVEIEFEGGPDMYDEMAGQMPAHTADASDHPGTVHIAAVTDDGKMYVLDLWESPEAFREFAQSQIGPAAPEGLEVNPRIIPVHNVIRGGASA